MSESISTRFYVQTNPTADTWLDVSADVLLEGTAWSKGIPSSDPLERMASVGVLNITLRNDGQSGAEHRYTPGHVNCTPGFGVRCKVKVVSTWRGVSKTQWCGWIPPDGISQSMNGPVAKFAHVTAYDYMYFLLNNPVTLAEILSDKNLGEVGEELIKLIAAKPSRVDQTQYTETFANTNDTVVENTTIYRELDKAAKSELGYVLVKYEPRTGADDICCSRGARTRHHRALHLHPRPGGGQPADPERGRRFLPDRGGRYPDCGGQRHAVRRAGRSGGTYIVNGAHYAIAGWAKPTRARWVTQRSFSVERTDQTGGRAEARELPRALRGGGWL
jgi:hypothetical protein